ncbi:MAG: PorT family protein [Prevotella histicola]
MGCKNDKPEQVQDVQQPIKSNHSTPLPPPIIKDDQPLLSEQNVSSHTYNKVKSRTHYTMKKNTKRSYKRHSLRKTKYTKTISRTKEQSVSSSVPVSDGTNNINNQQNKKTESAQQSVIKGEDNIARDKTESNISTSSSNTERNLSNAQRYSYPYKHLFRVGLRTGIGYSKITGLSSIIENYDIRPTFTMNERGGINPRIGIFGTWQYRRLGAELGIDYTRILSKLTEHKIPENVTETTRFHYNFITPQVLLRFYIFPKFYMGAGISAAIPFGSRNIDFTNDRIGEVYRQQAERTQDHLRESVKARVTFIPTIKIGYVDIKNGLEAGLEYGFGFNDMLRTSANDYGYQERMNNLQTVSLTIGYSLPIGKAK